MYETIFPHELELLSNATKYQKWKISEVSPFFGKRILELGSGMGNLSQWLPKKELLVLTEADPALFSFLTNRFKEKVTGNQMNILKIDLDHSFAT